MKSISGKKLCKVLEKLGWILVRIKGSHYGSSVCLMQRTGL
ncbi:type II toxin-antitoxin system HicA family toxin [Microcystis aeruginosa]